MIFFKKKADGFFRGLGAEFAFKTKEGIFIISGGMVLKVVLRNAESGGGTQVVLVNGPKDYILFEGGMQEAARRFIEISNSATDSKNRVHPSRKGTVAILAAFTALALAYSYLTTPYATATSEADVKSLLESLPTVGQTTAPGSLPMGIPAGMPAGISPNMGSLLPPAQSKQLETGSLIVDKPAFLSLPGEQPPETKAAVTKDDELKEEASVVPAYSKDLYAKKPVAETSSVVDRSVPETVGEGPTAKAPDASANDVKAADATAKPQSEGTAAPETSPAIAPKQEASSAVVEPSNPDAPKDVAKATGIPDTLTPDQAKKLAQTAVTNMLSSGMTADQATAVMGRLESLNRMPPDQITPEMLEGLPHELVTLLKESGVSDAKKQGGENGVPYAMIRLPEGVIERYRGKDGIPSIPTNDSYAALGNKITLQLPGGGDIKSPEDMAGFGFKP